ncbi:hypothetical protein F4808DRAFT_430865 [Astrocystis sublimbata]|nr:hypothetical protein F4808DRAFT_430865 [Astrocystis sublimbata]
MAELRSIIQKTIDVFVENNTLAVKQKDVTLLSSVLAEHCSRMYRPLSFIQQYPHFFKSRITNAEYEAQMKGELLTMQDVSQHVTRTVIDTTQRAANVWIEKTVHTTASSSTVEVVCDLSFTEDGTQITQVVEFVDTSESIKVLEQILSTMS